MDTNNPVPNLPPSPATVASTPITSDPSTPVASTQVAPFGYGGFWRRYYANLIDSFIVGLITSSIGYAYSTVTTQNGTQSAYFAFPGFLLAISYYLFFWVKQNGQTLGKQAMGLRILKEDGQSLDIGTAVVRYIGYFLSSFFCLGYITAAFDSRKQGWHDKIAHTVVVKTDDKSRKGLIILIGFVIPFIIILIFVAIFATVGMALFNVYKNNPDQLKKLSSGLNAVPTMSIVETKDLSSSVFTQINQYRRQNGLNPIAEDPKLCAYAQRRLGQIEAFGRYDDSKGFYEDINDPKTVTAFFTGYNKVGEQVYNLGSTTTAQDIIAAWSKDQDNALSSTKYTNTCVRADSANLVVISGEAKTKK